MHVFKIECILFSALKMKREDDFSFMNAGPPKKKPDRPSKFHFSFYLLDYYLTYSQYIQNGGGVD